MKTNRNDDRSTAARFSSCVTVVILVGFVVYAGTAVGQSRSHGAIGLGGQIGDPAGVTLKFRQPQGVSYDFMAAWSTGDFFYVSGYGLLEQPIRPHKNVRFFYGPGAYIGIHDRGAQRTNQTIFGISAEVGIGVLLEQFELYGQLIPRLDLAPATNGDMGAGIGVRYYF